MVDWITETMASLGYGGIILLMFLENIFPPIPSELIMPLAGFTAARGDLDLGLTVVAGVIGTMLGTLPWYYGGRVLGQARLNDFADRYGKWCGISSQTLNQVNSWFQSHGHQAVFWGRLVPTVRTLVSTPAGLAPVPLGPFLAYSTLGTGIWISLLTGAGYLLGENYSQVGEVLAPVSQVVLVLGVVGAGSWFLRRRLHP